MQSFVDLMAQRESELLLDHRFGRADALAFSRGFFGAAEERGKLGADPLNEVAEEEKEALRFLVREKPERHDVVGVFLLAFRGQIPSTVQLEEEEQP